MRSMRGLAVLAAAVAAIGLAPAVPAAASIPVAMQWKATFGPVGHAATTWDNVVSPDGSTVYTAGAAGGGSGGEFAEVLAYKAATGAVVWKARFSPNPQFSSGFNVIAVSPDGSTVFVTGWIGNFSGPPGINEVIVAYNAATGAQLWQVTEPQADSAGLRRAGSSYREDLAGPAVGQTPVVVSPDSSTLYATTLIAGSPLGETAAYNATTGAQIWSVPVGGSALTVSSGGTALYVTDEASDSSSTRPNTQAFNATTGASMWRTAGSPFTFYSSAALSPDGAALFVTGARKVKNGTIFKTTAYSTSSGTRLWSVSTGFGWDGNVSGVAVTPDGSAVIVNNSPESTKPVLHARSQTVALNPQTGATLWSKSRWHGTDNGYTATSLALSPDGSTAYVAGPADNTNGVARCLAIGYSTATGALVWSARYSQRHTNSCYAVAVSPAGSQVFLSGTSAWRPHSSVMITAAYPAA